jgi:probable addiction module antidote protein
MAKKLMTRPYDAATYLRTEQECALYLQAAIDESDGDPALVVGALGDLARARGMMQLARDTGLTREGLYKALSPEGNPSFATVMKVCKALGLKLHMEAVES